jgi:hypothetical protein
VKNGRWREMVEAGYPDRNTIFSTALRRSRYDEFGISMYHSFMATHIQERTLFKSSAEQERLSEYPRM